MPRRFNRVVLVRPMAVIHQTDTEQKVLKMPHIHDHTYPTRLTLTAPHGGHPHSLSQQGYNMMFALNTNGVPSVRSGSTCTEVLNRPSVGGRNSPPAAV